MKRGYTKSWRKEIDSDIWQMPPLYHRVFYWLRQKAPWKPETFPTQNKMNINLNPGQIITSMGIIAEGVAYIENNVRKVPQRKTIQRILEWLEFNGIIALARHRQGTTIFILKWHIYQPMDEETCHSAYTEQDTDADTEPDTHLKKYKEVKRINKKKNKEKQAKENGLTPPDWIDLKIWTEYLNMRKKIKKPMTHYAQELAVKELLKFKDQGYDPNGILETSIQNSWQGLFEPKDEGKYL